MTDDAFEQRIAAVRRFSRFYTRQLGLLQESLVRTRFSLSEARVLYELAHRDQVTASALAAALDLDHGYLSRILRRFGEDGLLKKARAPDDARQSLISITAKGRKAFAPLNKGSRDQVAELLGGLSTAAQERVVGAMATVETLLGEMRDPPTCCGRIAPATWAG
jgi:DNA-binding MarR family transcriptional regulator